MPRPRLHDRSGLPRPPPAAIVTIVAAAAAIALAGCRSRSGGEGEGGEDAGGAAVPVTVARAAVHDIAATVSVSGTLEPPPGRSVRLGALVAGRIAALPVAEGDPVAVGQVVVRLEATQLRDAVAQAEAALRQARAQRGNAQGRLERARKLFDVGVAARQEVDDAQEQEVGAQAAVHNAQAALSTAKNQLGRSELRAPFAGIVAHLFAAAGEPVDGSGKPVIEIDDTRVLELRAGLDAARLGRVRPGLRAEVAVDGLGGRTIAGVLSAVAPVIDAATGVGLVRIRVDNPEGLLKGGAAARARIVLEVHPNALVVPRAALVPNVQGGAAASAESEAGGGGAGSFAVERVVDGRARRQRVEVGVLEGDLAEIRNGLAAGDPVIVQGAYALPDGTPVRAAAPAAGNPGNGGNTGTSGEAGNPGADGGDAGAPGLRAPLEPGR